MNRVLLIGAGFSRNWDGLLADEVSSHLSSIIQNNSFLINLLHQCDGFEAAFEKLRINYQTDPNTSNRNNIQIFQNALRDVFGNMNLAYSKKGTINFSQDRNLSIVKFLARFNSIFSLNQDLLLPESKITANETDSVQLTVKFFPKGFVGDLIITPRTSGINTPYKPR